MLKKDFQVGAINHKLGKRTEVRFRSKGVIIKSFQ